MIQSGLGRFAQPGTVGSVLLKFPDPIRFLVNIWNLKKLRKKYPTNSCGS
jgi:hypothetical protein